MFVPSTILGLHLILYRAEVHGLVNNLRSDKTCLKRPLTEQRKSHSIEWKPRKTHTQNLKGIHSAKRSSVFLIKRVDKCKLH